jgi:hypothetical protein
MKKLLVTIAAVLVSVSAFAQGSVTFNNRTGAGDVKISLDNGAGPGTLAGGASAALYLKSGGNYTLVPNSTTTFRTTPAAATFFVNPLDVVVPGVAAGGSATFQVRAWAGASSFEAAQTANGAWFGNSPDFTVAELSGTDAAGNIHVPTDISGLQAFSLHQVPEPSTIALGVLGAAALFIRRRK